MEAPAQHLEVIRDADGRLHLLVANSELIYAYETADGWRHEPIPLAAQVRSRIRMHGGVPAVLSHDRSHVQIAFRNVCP